MEKVLKKIKPISIPGRLIPGSYADSLLKLCRKKMQPSEFINFNFQIILTEYVALACNKHAKHVKYFPVYKKEQVNAACCCA